MYSWWKQKHHLVRKPLVFVAGIILVMIAPFIGSLPGPGGLIIFLLGIAILGSEFAWAHQLRDFFLHTVPKEVKKRWQPTPLWEYSFDVAAACLFVCGLVFGYYAYWLQAAYCASTGMLIFIFNRRRIERTKNFFRRR